jgi:hypothetical protein
VAFRRRKIKDSATGEFISSPVKCSICKEIKAFTTVHGCATVNGGRTCCDSCFPDLKGLVTG